MAKIPNDVLIILVNEVNEAIFDAMDRVLSEIVQQKNIRIK